MNIGPERAIYLPALDQSPAPLIHLPFENWWNEVVFRSSNGVSMSRSGFILHTANQAGGAHVDPELDEDFHKIAKANEAGWVFQSGNSKLPMMGIERAYVRHIGHEVLNTLNPEWTRIVGNRFCECGSGRKYRYCHGKSN